MNNALRKGMEERGKGKEREKEKKKGRDEERGGEGGN